MGNYSFFSQKESYKHLVAAILVNRPEYYTVLDRLNQKMELAVFKATGCLLEPEQFASPDEGTLEYIILKRLKQIEGKKRVFASPNFQAKKQVIELRFESTKYREVYRSVREQLYSPISIFKDVRDENLMAKRPSSITYFETRSSDQTIESDSSAYNNKLALRVHSIKCIDETDGFFGAESRGDEMALSAVITEIEEIAIPGTGNKVPYKNIFSKPAVNISSSSPDGKFGDNDIMIPSPAPWYYHTFDIWNPSHYYGLPKFRSCSFILSEIDNAGLNDFVESITRELAKIVTNEVVKEIEKEVARRAGSVIGGSIGSLAGGLAGAAIGYITGSLLDKVIDLIIEIWEDDMFTPQPANIIIPGFNDFLGANRNISELLYLDFEGHGGRYQLAYSWELIRNPNFKAPSLSEGWEPRVKDPDRGATIYSLMEYTGRSHFLKMGEYSLTAKNRIRRFGTQDEYDFDSGAFFKKVNSVKVDPDVSVRLYKTDDFTGEHLTIAWDTPLTGENDSSWWNAVGSIIVGDISMYQNEWLK